MKEKGMDIFLSGIAGSGMSAIALFMARRGHKVSGSDRLFDSGAGGHIKTRMLKAGITLFPQDGSGIRHGLTMMIMSTAVDKDRPEVIAANKIELPVMTRPEFLAALVSKMKTLAIAGTSGKSTASGMLAYAMRQLQMKPNFIGGGRVKNFIAEDNTGNMLAEDESNLLVIEADESDGSIVNYRPEHSVILNLSLDHNPVSQTAGMFRELINNTSGHVIINADDSGLMELANKETVTFSIKADSRYRAESIEQEGLTGCNFMVQGQKFWLNLPGRHNILNALSCIALLNQMGKSLKDISHALEGFSGIERRMDIKFNENSQMVIDDYAHNPHKINALMDTIKNISNRACYIFQPHGFGPLRMMLNEYADTFNNQLRDDDRLFVLPVYYAGGKIKQDISSADLASLCGAEALSSREALLTTLDKTADFDCYITFGARDDTLAELALEIASKIQEKQNN